MSRVTNSNRSGCRIKEHNPVWLDLNRFSLSSFSFSLLQMCHGCASSHKLECLETLMYTKVKVRFQILYRYLSTLQLPDHWPFCYQTWYTCRLCIITSPGPNSVFVVANLKRLPGSPTLIHWKVYIHDLPCLQFTLLLSLQGGLFLAFSFADLFTLTHFYIIS